MRPWGYEERCGCFRQGWITDTKLEPLARRLSARFTRRAEKADTYALHTLEVLYETLSEQSNVIDVGAHTGSVLRWATRLAPLGSHMAFEPLPALCSVLRSRYSRVNVQCLALSDQPGEANFLHVVNFPAYSGFRRQTSYPQPPVIKRSAYRPRGWTIWCLEQPGWISSRSTWRALNSRYSGVQ